MEEISLVSFSSLIQLWAGICLLFFYEPLLEKFPLVEYQKRKEALFSSFLGKNQGFISDESLRKGYEVIDSKWDLFHKTIQNFATLGFLYCVFLLAFIGIESVPMYEKHYQALQIMDVCIITYSLFAWLFYKTKWLKGYKSAIILFVILLIFYHLCDSINNIFVSKGIVVGYFWMKSHIYVLTLFTCFSGAFITLAHVFLEWVHSICIEKRLKKINATTDVLTDYLTGLSDTSAFPSKLQKKAAEYLIKDGKMDLARLNQFAAEEIQNTYNSFICPWYVNLYNGLIKRFFSNRRIFPIFVEKE